MNPHLKWSYCTHVTSKALFTYQWSCGVSKVHSCRLTCMKTLPIITSSSSLNTVLKITVTRSSFACTYLQQLIKLVSYWVSCRMSQVLAAHRCKPFSSYNPYFLLILKLWYSLKTLRTLSNLHVRGIFERDRIFS